LFFFSSRRRHTRSKRDWSSDVCSSDLEAVALAGGYTRIAAPERITVRRHKGSGDQVFKVNAKRFTKGSGGGFLVEPGDTITVGEIGRASCRERVEIAAGGVNVNR